MQGTITADQAPTLFPIAGTAHCHLRLCPAPPHRRCSDGRLQLTQVPLVHAVVAHQLVRARKLLLTVRPVAGKRLFT